MKKMLVLVVCLLVFPCLVFAQELVTGSGRKFTPPDKVLFETDFSRCPVGEPPTGFEKVKGAGECVRFGNQIWVAPATDDDYRLYKSLALGRDEFSIEFDYLPYQDMSGAIGPRFIFRFLESRGGAWDQAKPPYDLKITGTYNMCNFKLEGVGRIGEVKDCHKKKLHIALQVRRGQLRVYVNGKRLTLTPFNLTPREHISGFELMFVEDTNKYGALISNIKAGKYTVAEQRPCPEKLGIKMENIPEGTKLIIPEKVLFDFNQFFLKEQARKALKVVAQILNQNPDKAVRVVGYTDNVGSETYNLRLSLQRAQSVADYLIYVEGISSKRIKIEGKGEANPVADNSTEQGRARNRRVEIIIQDSR